MNKKKVMKGVYERIDEGVLWWFVHVENDRIAKRVYVEVFQGRRVELGVNLWQGEWGMEEKENCAGKVATKTRVIFSVITFNIDIELLDSSVI